MIDTQKLTKPSYDNYKNRENVPLICDYCGVCFERNKKLRIKCNTIIDKDSCGSKSCKSKKMKEASLEKYGVESHLITEEFKKKQAETNLKKFGVRFSAQNQEIKDKIKTSKSEKDKKLNNTNLTPQEKSKLTNLSKYGVEFATQSQEIKNKIKQSNIEKYGHENTSKVPEIIAKKMKTNLMRYGSTSYFGTSDHKEMTRKKCLEEHGVEFNSQRKDVRSKYESNFIEKYGVPNSLMLVKNPIYGKTEKEIRDWLNSIGYSFSTNHSILKKRQLDMYDDSCGLAIEYCGLFWHNEHSRKPKLKGYHYSKYIGCVESNVRLITLYEDEWLNNKNKCQSIFKSILKKNTKIFAKKCKVVDSNKKDFDDFCIKNHLEGMSSLGDVFYLLKNGEDIVGGISLHKKSSDELLIDRLCFKLDTTVVGGSSKLFKSCVMWAKENKYKKIIGYTNNRWSQGNICKKLGFKLDAEIEEGYEYVAIKHPTLRIDKSSCPINKTEFEWAGDNGLARIWDCGKKRWVFDIV